MDSVDGRQIGTTTAVILGHLANLREGDDSAREELLKAAQHRLRVIARRMFKDFRRLRAWEETDDVFQTAMLRLHHSLAKVKPASSREFFGLASQQIRRTLVDIARHYYGPRGPGTNQALPGTTGHSAMLLAKAVSHHGEPTDLMAWTEFHEYVQSAESEDRELFDLLWYQGLKQVEAAELLGISERAVRQRWTEAKIRLHARLMTKE